MQGQEGPLSIADYSVQYLAILTTYLGWAFNSFSYLTGKFLPPTCGS